MSETLLPPAACLLCGAPLRYLSKSREMTCALCGKSVLSGAACENSHYICDGCHAQESVAAILRRCAVSDSRDPLSLAAEIMRDPSIHMHGNEHHVLAGAALLTAYRNCGGPLELPEALAETARRGGGCPGGACGFWGCCGAAVSAGIFVSIALEATPLSGREWSLANRMTAGALEEIARHGGPRCCKRDCFAAITAAVRFSEENLGVSMALPDRFFCDFSALNRECLRDRCPYFPDVPTQ